MNYEQYYNELAERSPIELINDDWSQTLNLKH